MATLALDAFCTLEDDPRPGVELDILEARVAPHVDALSWTERRLGVAGALCGSDGRVDVDSSCCADAPSPGDLDGCFAGLLPVMDAVCRLGYSKKLLDYEGGKAS